MLKMEMVLEMAIAMAKVTAIVNEPFLPAAVACDLLSC